MCCPSRPEIENKRDEIIDVMNDRARRAAERLADIERAQDMSSQPLEGLDSNGFTVEHWGTPTQKEK